jgi:hypothetical protein
MRYRESYFATKAQNEAEERPSPERLLQDPLDATQLGLFARAATDAGNAGLLDVQVLVDLHDVQLRKEDGKWVGSVEVSFHLEGAKAAQIATQQIEIPDDQLASALDRGFVIRRSIEWPGKASDLRVAVEDKTSGAAGSLRIPLRKN